MIAGWWIACGEAPRAPEVSRPPVVPADAARVWFSPDAVWVGEAQVVDRAEWIASPTQATDDRLIAALTAERPVWIDLPADAPFWVARTAVASARAARASAVYVGIGSDAVSVGPGPKLALGLCTDDPVAVPAAAPVVTFALETNGREAWLRGTVRFVAVLDEGPTAGLDECLDVPEPRRLLAGACLTGDPASWRASIAAAARGLALSDGSLLAVVPEARAPMRAILPVLLGLVDAGIRAPGLPTAVLVEGNDGPPACTDGVSDAAALAAVGDAWVRALSEAQSSSAP